MHGRTRADFVGTAGHRLGWNRRCGRCKTPSPRSGRRRRLVEVDPILWTVWRPGSTVPVWSVERGGRCLNLGLAIVFRTTSQHGRSPLESRNHPSIGTLWPIASFGSPGGHSLYWGTAARRPGPEFQWMLSPLSVVCPDRATGDRRHHSPPERSTVRLGCVSESLRVVHLLRAPQRQHDGRDLPGDG